MINDLIVVEHRFSDHYAQRILKTPTLKFEWDCQILPSLQRSWNTELLPFVFMEKCPEPEFTSQLSSNTSHIYHL